MAAGGFLGLVHAVLSIHLRANQVISGTAVNILGLGITSYGTNAIFGSGGSGDVPRIPSVLHFLEHVPLIGDVIGGLNLMIYVALALVIVSWWFLFRTAWGLRLRAVGEHPRAADTVGIPVFRDPLRRGHALGRAGRHGRRLSRLRPRLAVQREHDRRPRLHRARRADLRQVEALGPARRRAPVRVLAGARRRAADDRARQRVPRLQPAVHLHAGRARRRDRPLARAGGRRTGHRRTRGSSAPAHGARGSLATIAPRAVASLA